MDREQDERFREALERKHDGQGADERGKGSRHGKVTADKWNQ